MIERRAPARVAWWRTVAGTRAVLWVALIQLVIGTCVVRLVYAQGGAPVPVSQALGDYRIGESEKRLDALDATHLDLRVAVLEATLKDIKASQGETQKLMYGAIVGILGSLAAHLFQIRERRR